MERISYDPETGKFTWKKADKFHPNLTGCEAGCINGQGYMVIGIGGKSNQAHRIAWLIVHGELPDQLDHINRNKADNRIVNLRSVTQTQSQQNKVRIKKSGLPQGVNKTGNKFMAQIHHNGKRFHLGTFDTVPEAESVYSIERSIRFGEFAPR